MKKTYTIILLLLLTLGVNAQEQVVKTSPLGYSYGMYNLQYERMLTDYTSVNASASYLKPNLFGIEDVLYTLMDIDVLEDWSLSGVSFNVNYRLYSKNKTGPCGFYVAPYLRFMNLGFSARVEGDYYQLVGDNELTPIDYLDNGISVSRYGFGLKLGAQWLIKDMISIDWNFGGIGADLYRIKTFGEINSNNEDGDVVSVQDSDIGYSWLYAFPMNLTVGFAF